MMANTLRLATTSFPSITNSKSLSTHSTLRTFAGRKDLADEFLPRPALHLLWSHDVHNMLLDEDS